METLVLWRPRQGLCTHVKFSSLLIKMNQIEQVVAMWPQVTTICDIKVIWVLKLHLKPVHSVPRVLGLFNVPNQSDTPSLYVPTRHRQHRLITLLRFHPADSVCGHGGGRSWAARGRRSCVVAVSRASSKLRRLLPLLVPQQLFGRRLET